ncbi:hypothetical protein GCM10025777_47100 [Membranihabitans marinus]|uniref:Sce7726 family protein n=1 Tax=Nesterenkonia rhizosphaerae TaxID=1348272 RepID=A0ABP9FW52_9MICC
MSSTNTLGDAFDLAFTSLKGVGNRDDYVYRAALTQKIALGRHSLRTATVLNELRAGKSKADLVILNGTATAYEIKSERDSLSRLEGQLADYRSVFASTCVVTSPMQADQVLSLVPEDVGVLVLSSRFRLQILREAIDSPDRIQPLQLLSTLRVDEALQVLELLEVEFESVPNTQRWSTLQEIFINLDPASVHKASVQVLKVSRSQTHMASVLQQLPATLRASVLAAKLPLKAQQNVVKAVSQPLEAVLSWSEEQRVSPVL